MTAGTLASLLLAASAVSAAAPPAGQYVSGDGLGFNWSLALTRTGRFSFDWRGCLGKYDSNHGRTNFDGTWLTLLPELPRANGFARQLPLKWLYLAWGERHYLVASDELGEFVRAVNEGTEPRSEVHGAFLLRRSDWTLPAPTPPPLPAEWSALLRPDSVSASVLAVAADGIATLDRGIAGGLAVGLPLAVWPGSADGSPRYAWGTVTEATATSARFRVDLGDPVQVGDLATTRHP